MSITINFKKSLYAKKDIKKNEKFSINIAIKGPAGGLLPNTCCNNK